MQTFYPTLDVSRDIRAELGHICVLWSRMEHNVERAIWALKGVPQKQGRNVTRNMNIRPRLVLLMKLARQKLTHSQHLKVVGDTVEQIDKMILWRNRAVHGLWAKSNRPGQRRRTYALYYRKQDIKGTAVNLSSKQMKYLTIAVRILVDKTEVIANDLPGVLASSQKRSKSPLPT